MPVIRQIFYGKIYQYLGVGTYKTEAVQIFASSSKKIKSYTTSTGKTIFADEEAMAGEYLICTDQAGVKSYLPLDTNYMEKSKGRLYDQSECDKDREDQIKMHLPHPRTPMWMLPMPRQLHGW